MNENLINNDVRKIALALGHDADLHLVGGCVRDTILGVEPKDFDLATKFTPDQVEDALRNAGIPFVVTGIRRGTITALVDSKPFEITTFRNPANEREFVDNIETDLAARDFTFNAIALSVNTGCLVDPNDGIEDLNNAFIRCVGDPARRFSEDPHRILRLVRFGPGANRTVDANTFLVAKDLIHRIAEIAPERIHDEFIKIVCSENPQAAFLFLFNLGALHIILPELAACFGVKQNKYHAHDVFVHTLKVIENIPRENKIARLAAVFHDIGKPGTKTEDNGVVHFLGHEDLSTALAKDILARLKFSTEDAEAILTLIANHMRPIDGGPKCVRRIIRDLGNQFENWCALKRADKLGGKPGNHHAAEWQAFVDQVETERNRKDVPNFRILNINGNEIMELRGLRPGPEVGRIIKALEEAVLDKPELNVNQTLRGLVCTIN